MIFSDHPHTDLGSHYTQVKKRLVNADFVPENCIEDNGQKARKYLNKSHENDRQAFFDIRKPYIISIGI